MDIKKLIGDYLKEAKLMQVATCKNSQPWACSVYLAYDKNWNLYWLSKPDRRHSKEIRINGKVAGTIVLPHVPGQKVRGLQFQGTAKELVIREEVEHAIKFYIERFKLSNNRINTIIENKDDHLCYRIKPKLFVLFDEINFPNNPRQEFKL